MSHLNCIQLQRAASENLLEKFMHFQVLCSGNKQANNPSMAASDTGKKGAADDDSSLLASERQKYSPASSSCGSSRWAYEVFLSFRGEDTRHNFTDHLYAALNKKGIYSFRDDERLERGKEISSELLEAIERSLVSIIILSKYYATSTWCLDELVKIVECMEAKDQTVLPLFYKVDPSDVRKQRGDFKTAFDKHEQDFRDNPEKVERWRSAITRVGKISGWHLDDGSQAELINIIVDNVWERLNQIPSFPSVDGELVGMDSRVEEIYELLRPDISDEIRFVGIWGMGGIGKTTIAKFVYERLSYMYEGRCFLANVREVSDNKKGLESLQKMLLRELLNVKDLNTCDYRSLIRRWLPKKKIFLVLDDVDQLEQLEGLAGSKKWFGVGSRIIVTTRDVHVLKSHGINDICKVRGLNYDEAHKLFYLKAFKCIGPTYDHIELSKHIVFYANGLPLALKVLGSSLCDRNVNEWKSELDRLEADPDQKIMKILRISYDGLKRTEKKIFLDIACFFKGKDVDKIKKILDSCNLYADAGISVLEARSLITIEGNKFQMHDMVQELGWEEVRQLHPDEPGKWSRIWLCEDVYRVLARNMGTSTVEVMIPIKHKENITHANGKCFSTMSKLRVLNISNIHIFEDLEYLSDELRFLKWQEYPLKTLPSSFHPEKLFHLSLCYSRIEYLWSGTKHFTELKTIKLSYSRNFVETPDFTRIPNLERLDLQYCIGLRRVHPSVGYLRRLVVLNLNKCENLVEFPSDVCGLKSLQILNLHGCSKLDRLPTNVGEMEHLEELDVSGTAIRQVPSSIVQLTNLRTLSFRGKKGGTPKTWISFLFSWLLPTRKPDCMGLLLPPLTGLSSLQTLDLSYCNLSDGSIPSDFSSLCFLEELNLGGNNFISLPDSISQLSNLQILYLEKCHRLQSLPKLPPRTVFVGAEDCTSLKTIPNVLELTSPYIALHFSNCINLLETQVRNNNSLAIKLLKRWLQINNISNHDPILGEQFHIRLPGSEIPNLFNFQSEGSEVTGRLPDDGLDDEFIGFAVCAVFSTPDHLDRVRVRCKIHTTAGVFFVGFYFYGSLSFTTVKSDHLWLACLSRKHVYYGSRFGGFTARFMGLDRENYTRPLVVKRCGIRPLYKQDVEYLEDLSTTDVGISMGQEPPMIKNCFSSPCRNAWHSVNNIFAISRDLTSVYLKEMEANSRGTEAGTNLVDDPNHDDDSVNGSAEEGSSGGEDSEANSRETEAGTNLVDDLSHDDDSENSSAEEGSSGSQDFEASSRGTEAGTNLVDDLSHDDDSENSSVDEGSSGSEDSGVNSGEQQQEQIQ